MRRRHAFCARFEVDASRASAAEASCHDSLWAFGQKDSGLGRDGNHSHLEVIHSTLRVDFSSRKPPHTGQIHELLVSALLLLTFQCASLQRSPFRWYGGCTLLLFQERLPRVSRVLNIDTTSEAFYVNGQHRRWRQYHEIFLNIISLAAQGSALGSATYFDNTGTKSTLACRPRTALTRE
ncbi:hypothetical protein FB567DRAFT_141586 [Paraphoma chrysanthemicola]|uniref:Uncharacterized protein n=1 Tax=Paraphoma chrysanthemicola TaxID=798071 RepID=A0A8K0QZP0_9PLEO|nr:hypothetical protein FB567DRAFT_141586 [Paraphoma chrysanthemicola]